jgi:small subunit ribosomal protein S6
MGKAGGRLTLVENWGRRQLAYPVQKHTRGVYVYVKYTGGGELVSELERNFRMLDDVLKFQTVKVREDLDPASVEVDESAVKFEDVAPPAEDEPEETLERQLGLEEAPPHVAESHSRDKSESKEEDSKDSQEPEAKAAPASDAGSEEAE